MTTPPWAAHLPTGLEHVALDLLAARSLPEAWATRWRARPDALIIRDPGGEWLAAGALERESASVAHKLLAAGARPGDRIILSATASNRLVVAHCGALRAGLVVIPTNSSYTEREAAHIVADARPTMAIVDEPRLADAIAAVDRRVRILDPGIDLPDGPEVALDRSAPSDPAMICYTSGTTGAPKGAVLSHGNVLASAAALVLSWRWTAEDRLILCLPLFHMHGLGVGLHGTLLAGASAVLQAGFEPSAVLDAAGDEALGATMFFGVPTMYARLIDHPSIGSLGRLRLCVSGSAPLPAELHGRLRTATGQAVLERYGMTETVMLVSNPFEGERKPGTVGLPLPGVEVRLGDRDEIEVRGPNVFAGYWERPEATAESFRPDGWFRTGDVGSFDADGYLSIVGRTKELIISGGFNVYPREVEDVLRSVPGVRDAAVVGTPSAEWGEVVTAYLELADEHVYDEAQLRAIATAELAPYKRPRLVHIVVSLPRNSLGKVVRRELTSPSTS